MGGLIVVVLWPMILPVAILYFLDVALNLFAPILLGLNIAGLAFLLLIRWLWKRSGAMDWAYINGQTGWKRTVLGVLRWILRVCIAWEALLVAFFAAYLIWGYELL
ncbi:MAG: hypothetical protein HFF58_01215 [Lawsonibacter sp.]|nr:hypothetical protein [Lawsonibacter sp.]